MVVRAVARRLSHQLSPMSQQSVSRLPRPVVLPRRRTARPSHWAAPDWFSLFDLDQAVAKCGRSSRG